MLYLSKYDKTMEKPRISLVIPAYNEEKYIGDCLQSVNENRNGIFEVIVVDNASSDNTREVASRYLDVRVIRQEKRGTNNARQMGLSEARGDLVAFIDADCRLHNSWYTKLAKKFEENPNMVALSGPPKYYDLSYSRNFSAR